MKSSKTNKIAHFRLFPFFIIFILIGIFAVPKDLCVQQYYKAVMSFDRNYPCKSLREIHFVDRDESMVRAIQEIFQLPENRQ